MIGKVVVIGLEMFHHVVNPEVVGVVGRGVDVGGTMQRALVMFEARAAFPTKFWEERTKPSPEDNYAVLVFGTRTNRCQSSCVGVCAEANNDETSRVVLQLIRVGDGGRDIIGTSRESHSLTEELTRTLLRGPW